MGLYLQENQGWERIFLYFWRKHGHGRIIGVRHATLSFWDLRHFDAASSEALPDLPLPDVSAVNGPLAWQLLLDSGHNMEKCIPVEAVRYQYLSTLKTNRKNKVYKKNNLKLLVLGDTLPETTHKMLNCLENVCSKISNKIEIWFKPHPANPINLDQYEKMNLFLMNNYLIDLFPKIDVVLSSVFTAASLDAFCADIPVMGYLDSGTPNFSPLREHSVPDL